MRDRGLEDQLRSLMQAFSRAEGSALKPRRTRLALVRAEAVVVPFPGAEVRIVAPRETPKPTPTSV